MHRNTVNPGFQAGFAVKMLHSPKDLQEDLLGSIGGVGRIGENAINQAVDGLVKFADEPGVGILRACLQFGHDRRLLGPDSYRRLQDHPRWLLPPLTPWRHLPL